MRKEISRICFGVVLYLAVLYGVQLILSLEAGALLAFWGDETLSGLFEGLAAVVSTALACMVLYFYIKRKESKGELFTKEPFIKEFLKKKKKMRAGTFISYAAMVFLLQVGCIIVFNLLEMLLNIFGLTALNSPALNTDYESSVTLALYAMIAAPLAEEFVFRGFVLEGLKDYGKVYAIIMSALIFSLMHGDIQQIFFAFAVGIIFGYTAAEYSALVPLLLHFFNNDLLAELINFLDRRLSDLYYYIVIALLVAICAVIVIMFCRKNISGLKEYIRANRTVKGAWLSLINVWFIIFAVFCFVSIGHSITPL